MSIFLGTHQNRLDGKGRVSVPALFRAALKGLDGGGTLILRPSQDHGCIEAWPEPEFKTLQNELAALDRLDEEHEYKAFGLYGESWPLEADKDGRVQLPEPLIAHAGLKDVVEFIGMGVNFYIWEPAAAAAYRDLVRQAYRARKAAKAAARDAARVAA